MRLSPFSGKRRAARAFAPDGGSEEAVAAYLEAMRSGDVAGMLATFAIETYVENADAQASLWRIRAFLPNSNALPLGGDSQMQIAAAKRCAELASMLCYQWLALSWPEEYGEFGGQAVMFQEEAEVEAFRAALAENDISAALREMEWIGFIPPQQLDEVCLSQNSLRIRAQQAAGYGCEAMSDVVARLSIGGEEWYQCMQCARYDGRWYNIAFSGDVGNRLGIDAYSAGLAPVAAGSAGGQRRWLEVDAPKPHEQGAWALRFVPNGAVKRVHGGRPTRRGLPPAAFWGTGRR